MVQATPIASRRKAPRRLDAAGQERALSCLRFAYAMANRFARGGTVPRQCAQEAAIDGLLYAAAHHDTSRGASFVTYSYRVIRHRLIALMKRQDTLRRRFERATVPFSALWLEEDGNSAFDPAAPPAVVDKDATMPPRIIKFLRRELPPRMLVVVLARHVEGIAVREIAAQLGLSQQAVRQRLQRAYRRLRRRWPPDSNLTTA